MSLPVLGTQFYHIALIYLNIHRPKQSAESAFEAARLSQESEVSIILAKALGSVQPPHANLT